MSTLRTRTTVPIMAYGPSALSRRTLVQQAAAWLGAGLAIPLASRPALAQSNEPEEWIVALPLEPASVAPYRGVTTTPADVAVELLVFDAMIQFVALYDGPGFKTEHRLAESHQPLSDTLWELKLRPGVTFHNGDPCTAEDVKYTYDVALAEGSPYSYLSPRFAKIEVIDPLTIHFHANGVQPDFESLLSFSIVPQSYREQVGADAYNENPIGNGAYAFVEWQRGTDVTLEAYPNYWGGAVSPRKLSIRAVPDPTTRVAELRTGGAHIISSPPVAMLAEIDADPAIELVELPGGRTIQYKINASKPPFDDVRVRRAVNLAIDRQGIIDHVLEGHAVPLVGTLSEGWFGWDPALEPYPYDPEQARQLLAESGYADSFETDFTTTNGVFLKDREVAEAVAAQLAEVGVGLNIVVGEMSKIIEDQAAGNFAGFLITPWGKSYSPAYMIDTQYADEPAHPDAELNRLIEQTRVNLDQATIEEAVRELNRYIHDQAYNLEIHSQSEFWAKRQEVDWQPYPVNSFSYAFLWKWHPAP